MFGQIPWNPGYSLNRIPGLHPVGGAAGYPEFLVPQTGYSDDDHPQRHCPTVDKECPEECRHVDRNKCRVCKCNTIGNQESSNLTGCPLLPSNCPSTCRKRDRNNCKICHCEGDDRSQGKYTLFCFCTCIYCMC